MFIEKAGAAPGCVSWPTKGDAGKAVKLAAHDVPQRVAGECVERKENNVGEQHERAHTDSRMTRKPKRADCVVPKYYQKDQSDIKEIAVQVLQDKGELCLAVVPMRMRFANGASRWIKKEGAIVGLTIVIAGSAKPEWRPQNQHGRRERPPARLD